MDLLQYSDLKKNETLNNGYNLLFWVNWWSAVIELKINHFFLAFCLKNMLFWVISGFKCLKNGKIRQWLNWQCF